MPYRVKDTTVEDPVTGHALKNTHRAYYVGRKPYIQVNPFTSLQMEYLDYNKDWFGHIGSAPPIQNNIDYNFPASMGADATNKALEAFTNALKDSAQNANNLLEMPGNVQNIVSKATALAKAANALKHGDISGAAKALGATVSGTQKQKIYKALKKPADAWLEFHFGWEPLAKDIGSSVDAMQGTGKVPPHQKHRVTGGGRTSDSSREDLDFDYGGGLTDRGFDKTSYLCGIRCGAEVTVSNPNLALANQMGFVNPLSVAWEAVPFSFVVDWFANVGQCLSAMTDFAGFDIGNGWTTSYKKKVRSYALERNYAVNPHPPDPTYGSEIWSAVAVAVVRVPSIPTPSFHIGLPKPFGIARGATAISLLVQQLNKL